MLRLADQAVDLFKLCMGSLALRHVSLCVKCVLKNKTFVLGAFFRRQATLGCFVLMVTAFRTCSVPVSVEPGTQDLSS